MRKRPFENVIKMLLQRVSIQVLNFNVNIKLLRVKHGVLRRTGQPLAEARTEGIHKVKVAWEPHQV